MYIYYGIARKFLDLTAHDTNTSFMKYEEAKVNLRSGKINVVQYKKNPIPCCLKFYRVYIPVRR